MESLDYLRDIAMVTITGVLVVAVLARLHLPAVTGLLLAGALVGPHALGLLSDPDSLRRLAEAGVVLLLFSIGLEFSMARLRRMARTVLLGGGLQVVGTTLAVTAVTAALGVPLGQGVFLGFVVALSSTAIVLQVLAERGEVDTPHGRVAVGVLIFQDLCVIPMALLVPVLAGDGAGWAWVDAGLALAKAIGFVLGALLVGRLVLPRVFARVDALRSREAFLLAILGVCVGATWLTSQAGLTLALGAFLAGLVLAGTDYSHRALGDIFPIRSVLASFFFISVGTLFQPRVLLDRPGMVAAAFATLVAGKWILASVAAFALRAPARVAVAAGAALAQFSEFGFVLVGVGAAAGVLDAEETATILAAGVLSMLVAPILVKAGPALGARAGFLRPLDRLLGARTLEEDQDKGPLPKGHVVIVGYGVSGRVLARELKQLKVPYVVLELNHETVRTSRAEGEPVHYADATSGESLRPARLARARAVVVMVNDRSALGRIVHAVRHEAPKTPILARTRYLDDREWLVGAGATEVVAEEVEAGIEMLARVMKVVGVPSGELGQRVKAARRATHTGDARSAPAGVLGGMPELAPLEAATVLVGPESHARGRCLGDLKIRTRTGAVVVAVRRGGRVEHALDVDDPFRDGDAIYLVGPAAALGQATRFLSKGEAGP